MHGMISNKRGAMLPVAQLINLSHPPAMPNLGSAAPKVVVKDAKGDMSAPTQWSERAPKIEREIVPEPKLPEKGSKGFASAKGAGRGKAKVTAGAGSPPPTALPSNTRMLSMLNNAKKNADDAKAAKQKSALSVAELEAQMLKMMSPPKPAGKPTAAKKSADAKKKPMNIKELEQNMLKGAAKKPSLAPGIPPKLPEGDAPRKPRTKKPAAAPQPPPGPPPMPSSSMLATATESAPKKETPPSDATEPSEEASKPLPRRMVPRFLLRTGKS